MKIDEYMEALPPPLCPTCGRKIITLRDDLYVLYEGLEPKTVIVKDWFQPADRDAPLPMWTRRAPSYELARCLLPIHATRCHVRWPNDHPSIMDVWT